MNQSCSSKVRSQYEVEQNINLLCTGKSRLGSCHTQAGSGNLNRSAAVRVNGNQSPIACNFESAEICAERLCGFMQEHFSRQTNYILMYDVFKLTQMIAFHFVLSIKVLVY